MEDPAFSRHVDERTTEDHFAWNERTVSRRQLEWEASLEAMRSILSCGDSIVAAVGVGKPRDLDSLDSVCCTAIDIGRRFTELFLKFERGK